MAKFEVLPTGSPVVHGRKKTWTGWASSHALSRTLKKVKSLSTVPWQRRKPHCSSFIQGSTIDQTLLFRTPWEDFTGEAEECNSRELNHTLCCPFFKIGNTTPVCHSSGMATNIHAMSQRRVDEDNPQPYLTDNCKKEANLLTKEVVKTFQALSLLHLKGAVPHWRREKGVCWYWIPQGNSLKIKILPELHVNFQTTLRLSVVECRI